MSRRFRLRPWQKAALEAFEACDRADFLAVATPGAGKTTFTLTAAVRNLATHPHRRLFVVVPTQHLKTQWANAASNFGLHLEPDWSSRDGRIPADMHGVIVTYQQVAADPTAIRKVADDAFVILDEVHHAGTERAWGDSVFEAFEYAAHRLSISGTPFRSDQNPIPFVAYDFEEAVAHFTYGYGDALRDGGVVRPVFFPRINGNMEWSAPDGAILSATFDDKLDRVAAGQRLRTALSLEGEWLRTVLDQGHEALTEIRREQPDAGGLVIAMDVDHARGIANLMQHRLGTRPIVATSDDPSASDQIAEFAAGTSPWIVAVRMVSEGVDIPRLRVGVWATNTVTELFFRQAVGRLVRWRAGMRRQKAFMFIPDDDRLRMYAATIGEERTHSLKRREEDGDQIAVELDALDSEEHQMSLFAAISAVAVVDDHANRGVFDSAHPEDLIVDDDLDDLTFEIELAELPPLSGAGGDPGTNLLPVSRQERKKELRRANNDRVQIIGHLTGEDHKVIHARLNDEAGITRISEATVRQLEKRLRAADRWVDLA